jgi:hypothetical protein
MNRTCTNLAFRPSSPTPPRVPASEKTGRGAETFRGGRDARVERTGSYLRANDNASRAEGLAGQPKGERHDEDATTKPRADRGDGCPLCLAERNGGRGRSRPYGQAGLVRKQRRQALGKDSRSDRGSPGAGEIGRIARLDELGALLPGTGRRPGLHRRVRPRRQGDLRRVHEPERGPRGRHASVGDGHRLDRLSRQPLELAGGLGKRPSDLPE